MVEEFEPGRALAGMVGDAGEILGLVGASGSGKSMTALAIMRLLPPYAELSGAVRLRGETLTGKSEDELRHVRGQDIGIVFQEPMTALNPLMCIGDQVAETVRLHRSVSLAEARRAARETLDLVGLRGEQGALDRLPYELSGGQRQRVAIAMAVVLGPPLLIADEPTSALDVSLAASVLAMQLFLLYERWKSLAALEAHLKSPYIKTLLSELPELTVGPPELHILLPVGE